MPDLVFAEWLPDQAALDSAGSATIVNALPAARGYRQARNLATQTNALGARCQGFIAAIDDAAGVYNIAGTADKLYRRNGTSWTDVSASTYSTASDSLWSMVKWGNQIIASNYADSMQVATIGSGNFGGLSGSPPKAKYLATMGKQDQFLIAGYLNVSGTAYPQRLRWPGIGTNTSWTVSAATQADQQDLSNCSEIRGLVGFEYITAFTDRGIWRGDYVGPPVIIEFNEVEKGRGLAFANAIASWGRLVMYLWEDGFYMFDGQSVAPIGAERVNRFFFNDLDTNYADRIRIAPDPASSTFMVVYPGAGSVSGACNHMLAFNWTIGRWSYLEVDCEHIAVGMSIGYTLEDLDNINSSLDALPFSLDSRNYMGGRPGLVGFSTAHKLGAFDGTPLAATLDTNEKHLSPGRRSLIANIRPLIDGAGTAMTAALVTRNNLGESVTIGGDVEVNADGLAPQMTDARYARVRVKVASGFNFALGADVEFTGTGAF